MSIPIDANKKWRFLYHNEIDPLGIPANLTKENGTICFQTLSGIKIELDKYNKEEASISGRYTIQDPKLYGAIIFKKEGSFSSLVGSPEGFQGAPKWRLWVDMTEKKGCSIL